MPPVMVTAWSSMTRCARHVRAPGNNEAGRRFAAHRALQLKGCVVTAGPLHCHRGMAKAIVERGWRLRPGGRTTRPGLMRDAKAAISAQSARGPNGPHQGGQSRPQGSPTAIVAPVSDMAESTTFPGLKAVARITSKRGCDKTVQRYFL